MAVYGYKIKRFYRLILLNYINLFYFFPIVRYFHGAIRKGVFEELDFFQNNNPTPIKQIPPLLRTMDNSSIFVNLQEP